MRSGPSFVLNDAPFVVALVVAALLTALAPFRRTDRIPLAWFPLTFMLGLLPVVGWFEGAQTVGPMGTNQAVYHHIARTSYLGIGCGLLLLTHLFHITLAAFRSQARIRDGSTLRRLVATALLAVMMSVGLTFTTVPIEIIESPPPQLFVVSCVSMMSLPAVVIASIHLDVNDSVSVARARAHRAILMGIAIGCTITWGEVGACSRMTEILSHYDDGSIGWEISLPYATPGRWFVVASLMLPLALSWTALVRVTSRSSLVYLAWIGLQPTVWIVGLAANAWFVLPSSGGEHGWVNPM